MYSSSSFSLLCLRHVLCQSDHCCKLVKIKYNTCSINGDIFLLLFKLKISIVFQWFIYNIKVDAYVHRFFSLLGFQGAREVLLPPLWYFKPLLQYLLSLLRYVTPAPIPCSDKLPPVMIFNPFVFISVCSLGLSKYHWGYTIMQYFVGSKYCLTPKKSV